MFGVFANDADNPFSFHDLALITDLLDGGPYLHALSPKSSLPLSKRGDLLFLPEDNPSSGQIIRRQLHCHFVSGKDLNKMHPHFS